MIFKIECRREDDNGMVVIDRIIELPETVYNAVLETYQKLDVGE